MNITYVTPFSDISVSHWSGTVYNIAQALEQRNNVSYITNLEPNHSLFFRIKKKLYTKSDKVYNIDRSPYILKGYASIIEDRLKQISETDILFSPSSLPLSHLKTNIPKVFYTDATFAAMINYYPSFMNLSKQYIKEGHRAEERALNEAALTIFSSEWAAQSAINNYNIDPKKVQVVPFGANLKTDYTESQIKNFITKRSQNICRILFLGVDWERKGGNIVLEVAKRLKSKGLEVELHIAGIDQIPVKDLPPYIINHGFISKATTEGEQKIKDMITQSHFLFVPSTAEAYGLVFCEAMAFGVPCISTNTGGIPTIIKDKKNGLLFPLDAEIEEYSGQIINIFSDKGSYNNMALSAYNDYKERLNWNVASKTITNLLQELI